MAKVVRSALCRHTNSRRLHASASLFKGPLNRTPNGMLQAELPGANCCRDQRCSWTYDLGACASLGIVMVSGLLPSVCTCCAALGCIIVFSLVKVGRSRGVCETKPALRSFSWTSGCVAVAPRREFLPLQK